MKDSLNEGLFLFKKAESEFQILLLDCRPLRDSTCPFFPLCHMASYDACALEYSLLWKSEFSSRGTQELETFPPR